MDVRPEILALILACAAVTIVPPEEVQVIVPDAVLPAGSRGRRAKAGT